jgi:peptidoglycan/xylan/chitin deacetylase (PgdA/CDA1 family)
MGRMQRIAELAERLGLVRALRPLHARWRRSLLVLAYHRVLPLEHGDASYPFDPDLISATPAQFEWQMEYLRRNFNPVSLQDVVAHLDDAAPLPEAAVAVTFDDGFSDTYSHAFPVLVRHRIPATVFVTTGYIDSGEPFWFEIAAYLALRAEPGSLELEECGQALPTGDSATERRRSLRTLQAVLKTLPNARRTQVISSWARRFASEVEPGALELSRPLSWTQVREMAAAGIGFGSHSVTHPNLAHLGDADLDSELAVSKTVLEGRLQRPVDALAYPIGTPAAFDARVIAAAARSGFKLAVSYVAGANPLANLERFALRRHGIGLHHSPRYFRALTALPSWFD